MRTDGHFMNATLPQLQKVHRIMENPISHLAVEYTERWMNGYWCPEALSMNSIDWFIEWLNDNQASFNGR
jgi:hypothetical protein